MLASHMMLKVVMPPHAKQPAMMDQPGLHMLPQMLELSVFLMDNKLCLLKDQLKQLSWFMKISSHTQVEYINKHHNHSLVVTPSKLLDGVLIQQLVHIGLLTIHGELIGV